MPGKSTTAIASTVAAALSAATAAWSYSQARRLSKEQFSSIDAQTSVIYEASVLPIVVQILEKHRDKEITQAREYTETQEFAYYCSPRGFAGLPDPWREPVRDLMFYYDHLGTIVVNTKVDIILISSYIGSTVEQQWKLLWPLIEAERNILRAKDEPRWDRFQDHFERLKDLCRENPPPRHFVKNGQLFFDPPRPPRP